jgi:hypothetical protein
MEMRLFLTVIVLALSSISWAQESDLLQDAITKPNLSFRCKELFKERENKLRTQQKLSSLLQRNEALTRKTPKNKEGIRARLQANHVRVRNELHLASLQLAHMEENIVRSGCPGLSL